MAGSVSALKTKSTADFWNPVFDSSPSNAFCTSSLSNGIDDNLPFSILYDVNEFESNTILPASVSLTTIAEFGSVVAFSKILFTKSTSTTSLSINLKTVGIGSLSISG